MIGTFPRLALSIAALAVSACATDTVSEDFLCEAQFGTPCTTIAAADGAQGRGALTSRVSHSGGGARSQPSPAHYAERTGGRDDVREHGVYTGPKPIAFDNGGDLQRPPAVVAAGPSLYNSQVLNPVLFRAPERVSTIWIAPFVGENGFLYQPGYVHFVVEEGRWFGPTGEEVAIQ